MKTTKILVLAALVAASALVGSSMQAKAGEFGYGGYGGYGCKTGHGMGDWWFARFGDVCMKAGGVKFSHGFFYPGLVQKHFTETWVHPYYKVAMHFDPHARMPYYWCEGHGVWYPISFIEMVGPGAKGPGPVVKDGALVGAVPGVAVGGDVGGPVDGAPAVGGAVGGAPAVGGAVAPVGGAAGGAPAAGGGAAPAVAPKADAPAAAKPVVAPASVSVAKAPAKVQPPAGTFDEAIPDDL